MLMREKLDENSRLREKTKADYTRPNLDLGSYSGDDDASAPKKFTWKRDPSESLSDWTIVVKTKGVDESEITTNTYHIHKHVVGAGPRGSRYFLKIFQTESTQEESPKDEPSTTRIELFQSAAIAFPEMLDFIYDFDPEEVRARTDTAVALRHLANHFEIPTLFESVNKFIEEDMDRKNIHEYLKEAKKYEDDIIINATMVIAAEAWEDMLLAKDGTPLKKSAYLDQLSDSDKLELMKRALTEAFFECKRSKSRYNYHYGATAATKKLTTPNTVKQQKVGGSETPRRTPTGVKARLESRGVSSGGSVGSNTSETPRRTPTGVKARLESRGVSGSSVGSNKSETPKRTPTGVKARLESRGASGGSEWSSASERSRRTVPTTRGVSARASGESGWSSASERSRRSLPTTRKSSTRSATER